MRPRDVKISVNFNWLLLAIAVLAVLKLTGVIAISWLWVFLWPVIGFVALVILGLLIMFLFLLLASRR